MPIYEYKCQLCGQPCELMRKFSDEPAVQCPHCDKPGLQRQISAPSFHLKGSGWYVTDFKNPNKTTQPEKSETTTTADKVENKTENTPENKSENKTEPPPKEKTSTPNHKTDDKS